MRRSGFLATGAALGASTVFSPYAIAAPGTTVTLGYLDSASGVLSDIAGHHKVGIQIAVDEANARGRVRWNLASGDDNSKPQTGVNEIRLYIDENMSDNLSGVPLVRVGCVRPRYIPPTIKIPASGEATLNDMDDQGNLIFKYLATQDPIADDLSQNDYFDPTVDCQVLQ